MNKELVSGLFTLAGAIIGSLASIIVCKMTIQKTLKNEMSKISKQRDIDLSIKLFDKRETYFAELLTVLSTVRNTAIDIIDIGHNHETDLHPVYRTARREVE